MTPLKQGQLASHVTILGWLHIVGHLFFLLIGMFIFLLLNTIGAVSGDHRWLHDSQCCGYGRRPAGQRARTPRHRGRLWPAAPPAVGPNMAIIVGIF